MMPPIVTNPHLLPVPNVIPITNAIPINKNNSKLEKSQNRQNDISRLIQIHRVKYGHGKEAMTIRDELKGFNPSTSQAMMLVKQNFGTSVRLSEIKALLNSIIEHLKPKKIYLPKLTRNENRSYPLCIKYIQDHIEILEPYLKMAKFCTERKTVIPVHDF
ncbi:hypothetical protein TRFO_15288 [Tritrichomonas foetus]|uniref:Uncharacterized protein n=1 Tax=Tritrichomonas foetus TaxID=1144522 RepID=A0A1J4KSU7_9EUKA|nr:hypothetical protein TRFO_15288 [Tritrichomonas foetus]|eukprot:OHT14367.1 hypothetical protein TRFO_15288 [Tritrichomonas foetus]